LQKVISFAIMLKQIEKIGVVASLLCGVHCLLTPLIVVAAPSLSVHFADNPEIEHWLILFSLVSSFSVLGFDAFRGHKSIIPLCIAAFGWALTLFSHHPAIGPDIHLIMSIVGGVIIAFAFLRNWQMRRHECEVHPLS